MATVGLALPQLGPVVDASLIRDFAQQAEAMGFDSLWVEDHFLYALQQEAEYAGSAKAQPDEYKSMYAPTELLAATAAWTSRIELGTSILVAGYYWPAQLAQRLATIDQLSNGRLRTVGLGVGWSHEEHWAAGVDPRTRGRRMEDFVPALRACWAEDPVRHNGPFFDFGPAVMMPKPVAVPRLMSGTWSEAGFDRATRLFDLWNPSGVPLARAIATLAHMNEQRPVGMKSLDAIYRIALENTAGVVLSIDDVTGLTRQTIEAGLEGVILDMNFCRDLRTSSQWLERLSALTPVLDAR